MLRGRVKRRLHFFGGRWCALLVEHVLWRMTWDAGRALSALDGHGGVL